MEYTVYLSTGSVDSDGNYNRDYAEIFRAPSKDGAMVKARRWLQKGWSVFEGKLPEWVKVTHRKDLATSWVVVEWPSDAPM